MSVEREIRKKAVAFHPVDESIFKGQSYQILFPDECPVCGSPGTHVVAQTFTWTYRRTLIETVEEKFSLNVKYCSEHTSAIERKKKGKARFRRFGALWTIVGLAIILLVAMAYGLLSASWTRQNLIDFAWSAPLSLLFFGGISYLVCGSIYDDRIKKLFGYDVQRIKSQPRAAKRKFLAAGMYPYDLLVIVCDREEYADKLHKLNSFSEILML